MEYCTALQLELPLSHNFHVQLTSSLVHHSSLPWNAADSVLGVCPHALSGCQCLYLVWSVDAPAPPSSTSCPARPSRRDRSRTHGRWACPVTVPDSCRPARICCPVAFCCRSHHQWSPSECWCLSWPVRRYPLSRWVWDRTSAAHGRRDAAMRWWPRRCHCRRLQNDQNVCGAMNSFAELQVNSMKCFTKTTPKGDCSEIVETKLIINIHSFSLILSMNLIKFPRVVKIFMAFDSRLANFSNEMQWNGIS